ncbi:MAG: stress responsive protein [Opitutales bacterium TMED158]|nr:MAG: stress responsive protein [Opitutales bacterium TMED158]
MLKKSLVFALLATVLCSFFAMADHHKKSEGRVLRHVVMFQFKDSSSKQDVQKVVKAFNALPSKIDSIIDYEFGVNNSPEGLDNGFTHVFLVTFADEAGRAKYLPHPDHKAFVDVLKPHLEKVQVLDYWSK